MQLQTLAEKLDPRWTALVVVDMQNDYLHADGTAVRSGGDLASLTDFLPRVEEIIRAARAAGVPVIYTRNAHGPDTDTEAWLERSASTRKSGVPRAALVGSWGAEWCGVQPAEGEVVITKPRYDAFLGTNLEYQLRARGIRTVVCCGTATNVCVESTARAAHMRDYYLVLAGDCCAASDPRMHDATLTNIERHFGTVANLAEITKHWPAR